MILVLHITFALSSVLLAGYMYFYPSKLKLKLTTVLALATLGSGSYLLITTPSHLLQSCIAGLIYLGVVVYAVVATRQKLAIIENSNNG